MSKQAADIAADVEDSSGPVPKPVPNWDGETKARRLTLLKNKFVPHVVLRPRLELAQERLPKEQGTIHVCDTRTNISHRSITDL